MSCRLQPSTSSNCVCTLGQPRASELTSPATVVDPRPTPVAPSSLAVAMPSTSSHPRPSNQRCVTLLPPHIPTTPSSPSPRWPSGGRFTPVPSPLAGRSATPPTKAARSRYPITGGLNPCGPSARNLLKHPPHLPNYAYLIDSDSFSSPSCESSRRPPSACTTFAAPGAMCGSRCCRCSCAPMVNLAALQLALPLRAEQRGSLSC